MTLEKDEEKEVIFSISFVSGLAEGCELSLFFFQENSVLLTVFVIIW